MKNCDTKVKTPLDIRFKENTFLLSNNIIHWNFLKSINSAVSSNLKKTLNTPLINYVKSMKISKWYCDFDRRITAMTWHPTVADTVAIGSKSGDIILWNFEQDGQKPRAFIKGIGPGGSIQNIIFDERDNGESVFYASVEGTVSLRSLANDHLSAETLLKSGGCDYDRWYTSIGISFPSKVLLAGNNKGNVNLLSIQGEKQWEKKLHKQKVTHIEFSPKETNCFVTTSVDKNLKVWDIRSIKNAESYLYSCPHEKPINSAYFSRTDGCSLLTTDQLDELRVYKCPTFQLTRKIHHQHKQFQHITPIKATWHPLRDIAVVGRYPNPFIVPEDRCVDFFDCETGEHLYQLFDAQANKKIHFLNEFNPQGDKLLSAVSSTAFVWKANFEHLESREKKRKFVDDESNSFSFETTKKKKLRGKKLK
ncbi:UNVERIFIED_CONTAM: hypothetical protein RMT77_000923 [Armadillidium vulgare]